jgi:hypothetical protein
MKYCVALLCLVGTSVHAGGRIMIDVEINVINGDNNNSGEKNTSSDSSNDSKNETTANDSGYNDCPKDNGWKE